MTRKLYVPDDGRQLDEALLIQYDLVTLFDAMIYHSVFRMGSEPERASEDSISVRGASRSAISRRATCRRSGTRFSACSRATGLPMTRCRLPDSSRELSRPMSFAVTTQRRTSATLCAASWLS